MMAAAGYCQDGGIVSSFTADMVTEEAFSVDDLVVADGLVVFIGVFCLDGEAENEDVIDMVLVSMVQWFICTL